MTKPAKAAVPVAAAAKLADSVVAMVLGQALAGAIEKGYQVVLVPAGDPMLWRDLAERARLLFNSTSTAADYRDARHQWLAEFDAAVAAYTLQPSGVGAGDLAEAGRTGGDHVQPTPKPPGEPS